MPVLSCAGRHGFRGKNHTFAGKLNRSFTNMLTRRHLRIKVLQAIYAFLQSDGQRIDTAEHNLLTSLDRIYDLTIHQLSFLIELLNFAHTRLEDGKQKYLPSQEDLNPNTRFIENQLLQQLIKNRSYQKHAERLKISWSGYEELTRRLYKSLRASELYKTYMALPETSYKIDKDFVISVFNTLTLPDPGLQALYEEKNVFWTNDSTSERITLSRDFFLDAAIDSQADMEILRKIYRLEAMDEGSVEVDCTEDSIYHENDFYMAAWLVNRILREFKQGWDEFSPLPPLLRLGEGDDNDEDFVTKLFRKTLLRSDELNAMINDKAHNWELERIAVMDVIIMKMAIVELMEFPSIPVKVSMNEYIELAKIYSTPKSSQFINGLLDKILSALLENKKVVKLGRGLKE